MNSTHLIIKGYATKPSEFRCCICGDYAGGKLKGKDYFGDTFRDYREMCCRESEYICDACALSLKDVPGGSVRYLDGSIKTPKTEKRGLGWRFFSWVLVEGEEPIAATKAHCSQIVEFLRNPPTDKQFSVIIADSGQKQLIYRIQTQCIHTKETPFDIQFETERVRIDLLFWRLLGIADKLSAVVGKMRVLDAADFKSLNAYIEKYGDDSENEYFVFKDAVTTAQARLAGFLCKGKEQ